MGRIPSQLVSEEQGGTGVVSQSVQKYSLAYVRPYHKEIARRLVLGQTPTEISKDLNISSSRISIIINSPLMQKEIKRLEDMRDSGVNDIRVQLQELQPTMIEVIERLAIYSPSESMRFECAKDLLDRGGTSKVTKFEGAIMHETHEQRLARLIGINVDNVKEPKNVSPKVIEAEFSGAHALSTSDNEFPDLEQNEDEQEKEIV